MPDISQSKEPSNDVSSRIELDILSQPNETTCGPTCLHAVYRYYNDTVDLDQLIKQVHKFEDGGTLAVWLGCHALERGYSALLFSCNLQVFDPTWFIAGDTIDIYEKLKMQARHKRERKLLRTTRAFMDFLKLGGKVRLEDVTRELIRKYLSQGCPILAGLSSTFLYRSARENPELCEYDDIRGEPTGHFVVLCGYDRETKHVLIADPLATNPYSPSRKYEVHIDRVICSILLGVLTYDANFLIIKKKNNSKT